jgi:hypothetical protein
MRIPTGTSIKNAVRTRVVCPETPELRGSENHSVVGVGMNEMLGSILALVGRNADLKHEIGLRKEGKCGSVFSPRFGGTGIPRFPFEWSKTP